MSTFFSLAILCLLGCSETFNNHTVSKESIIRSHIDRWIKTWKPYELPDVKEPDYELDSLTFLPTLTAEVFIAKSNFYPENSILVLYNSDSAVVEFIPIKGIYLFANGYPTEGLFSAFGSTMKDQFIGLERYLNFKRVDLTNSGVIADIREVLSLYFNIFYQRPLDYEKVILLSEFDTSKVGSVFYWNYDFIESCDVKKEVKNFYEQLKKSKLFQNGKLIGFVVSDGFELILIRRSSFDNFLGFYPYRVLYYRF
ncbi:MAG: hypothetical protein CMN32_04270 [Saprospirales bacterium]|nr:hypothetical protein [Saprospirales bacterium]